MKWIFSFRIWRGYIQLRTVFPSQQDDELMKILRRVGPDTLIPCFAVNIHGNKDVQIANEVNHASSF